MDKNTPITRTVARFIAQHDQPGVALEHWEQILTDPNHVLSDNEKAVVAASLADFELIADRALESVQSFIAVAWPSIRDIVVGGLTAYSDERVDDLDEIDE